MSRQMSNCLGTGLVVAMNNFGEGESFFFLCVGVLGSWLKGLRDEDF